MVADPAWPRLLADYEAAAVDFAQVTRALTAALLDGKSTAEDVQALLAAETRAEGVMPSITEEKLRELRERYRVAYTAYMSCVDALTALISKRERPSADLLEKEGKALRELNEARGAYRDALLEMASAADNPPR